RIEMAWIGLCALIALLPIGLLARGEAWGEWSSDEIARRAGYLPANLATAESTGWKGFNLLPDYLSGKGALGYLAAAFAGVVLTTLTLLIAGRLLARRRDTELSASQPVSRPPKVEGE